MLYGIKVRARMGFKFFGHPLKIDLFESQSRFMTLFDKVAVTIQTVPRISNHAMPLKIKQFFNYSGVHRLVNFQIVLRLVKSYILKVCSNVIVFINLLNYLEC